MMALLYSFWWTYYVWYQGEYSFYWSEPIFDPLTGTLLMILTCALLVFLVFFAIQYLSCSIFKRKWLRNLLPIILIIEECIVTGFLVFMTVFQLFATKGQWGIPLSNFPSGCLISPFACIAGAAVARLVHRGICKKKEKKAQALNPAQ